MQSLEQQISDAISKGLAPIEVKNDIVTNLHPKFKLRPYQKEAFARFNYVLNNYHHKQKPTQLLFHMATGSGKTLVMAGIILELYRQGYRNFIFFVNSTNIIKKTKDNFLNTRSSKYLFNETITINNKPINIKEVTNFETANQDDINIVFTTIQGLHAQLNNPKENALTYEDFQNKKIVLISDEAHHINAETKKGKRSKEDKQNLISWEETVNKIFNSNPENILLEFTATADLTHPEIKKKYFDKLLFDYPLKQFRKDKYSKEVHVLQTDLPAFERALLAVLLNQYRRKIFENHQLNIKPVILFKSKTIIESKRFYEEFVQKIKHLNPANLYNIKNKVKHPVIQKIFEYLDKKNITIDNFISELKEDFSENKCIAVNSQNDSTEKQLIINSLEDKNNQYRAIFAVDKLNEGWDVLNLFDIVRLYDTPETNLKSKKISKTTMSEAQLIGRGARYCPFKIHDNQPLYQRKYDDELDNELRICEELYYHSSHNPKYISELNKALIKIGIKDKKERQKGVLFPKKLKEKNQPKKNDSIRANIFELEKSIREKTFKEKLFTGYTSTSQIFNINRQDTTQNTRQTYILNQFEPHILRKALNKNPFYRFDNLKKYFPHLKSITEFLTSDRYVSNIKIEIEGSSKQVQNLSNQIKLEIVIKVFNKIAKLILQESKV